jgi:hypothetical protein
MVFGIDKPIFIVARAAERSHHILANRNIVQELLAGRLAIGKIGITEIDGIVESSLFHEGDQVHKVRGEVAFASGMLGVCIDPVLVGRKSIVRLVIVLQRDAELAKIIRALAAPRLLAGRLNSRQQQGHKNPDDRDDDE